jgi:glycosyltransferase involved in cell wall biosynthesis
VTPPFSVVCLSSQDWRVDLPTNRQQIMRRVATRGHDVLFVETGRFLPVHLARLAGAERGASLALRLFSVERIGDHIALRKSVNALPWGQKLDLSRRANTAASAAILRRFVRRLPPPVVLWVYDPVAAGLVGRLGESFAVYDCVDDYAEQVGPDPRRRALVGTCDRLAARKSRLVFATTEPLRARLSELNASTYLVPNVADYGHFAAAANGGRPATELDSLPRPILGFAGNMLPLKLDFDLLDRVAEVHPEWTLALIGPADPAAERDLGRLAARPNVRWLGAKPYDELPQYVGSFDVALIPYRRNPYTESCFPLKTYEYLAAGKPVAASGLPALEGVDRDVILADGPEAFGAAVAAALERRSTAERARRMAVAERHTWDSRASRLLELVKAELDRA